jgi:hypothetical protein
MRLFEEFWWASALSRLDTRDAQNDVRVRGVHYSFRAVPPEEVTTFNLVRRLAGRRRATGGLSIALHSRPLEGGNSATGRPPSGADLELAVEVAPGAWVDLALQAKKFNPASGKYDGWDSAQNAHLLNWAQASGRRGAGMLLYNSSDMPFTPPGQASSMFNLCCSRTWCHGWKWPRWGLPDGRSPLAISLVVDISDPRVSGLNEPKPSDIADMALPWECLFCPVAQKLPLVSVIGGQPDWVGLLQGPPGDEDMDDNVGTDANADVGTQAVSFSLVLAMSPEERDDYERQDSDG